MTPENSGQDILKEYAATQAKLKEIERERDLAARDLERAKAELLQRRDRGLPSFRYQLGVPHGRSNPGIPHGR